MADKFAQCDRWALERMNVPQRFWLASYDKIAEEMREPVRRYVRNIDAMLKKGVGFFLYGNAGTGKTSAATVLLKAGWERYKTGYYTTIKDLRYCVREEVSFDGTDSVMDRCRSVDVLVLDDLAEDDFTNFVFGAGEIEHLLVARAARSKTTVLSTKLRPQQIVQKAPTLMSSLKGQFLDVGFNGPNLNDTAALDLKRSLGVL
jgi:DNA replication protein DnaC